MTEGPTAGWYDDPDHPETKRYWDGAAWTNQRAARDRSGGASVGTLTIARGVALGIGMVVGVVWVIHSITSADDDSDCAIERAEASMRGAPLPDCY